MKAIVYDPGSLHSLRLGEAPPPQPSEHEVLIQVEAISLNFADIAFLAERRKPGEVIGFESAGIILEAAADGTGPAVGDRITGFGAAGGWAEQRAINVDQIGLLPDAIDFATAAAVPVTGVTALRAVRSLGSLVGQRVLITGASGGVGRMAVQLAALAGAEVIASIGSPERGAGLLELGADQVVVGLEGIAPVYAVLDNVGGELLAAAYALVAPNGIALSIGAASLQPTTIDFERARLRGGGRIEAFNVFSNGGAFGKDLVQILQWIAQDRLDPQIGWQGDWTQINEAVEAFINRKVRGKAVLNVSQSI
jgi:NADPH:quinone reductase